MYTCIETIQKKAKVAITLSDKKQTSNQRILAGVKKSII